MSDTTFIAGTVISPEWLNDVNDVVYNETLEYTPVGTGAVSSTVRDKLREVVSVKDFGATGDGVTDDAAAIQAAIDYAGSALNTVTISSGVGVYFPAGVYLINTELTVSYNKNGIGFYGPPGKGALLKTSQSNIVMFNVGDPTYVNPTYRTTFKNLNFVATNKSTTGTTAIKFQRTPDSQVFDCYFWDFGIAIDGYRLNQSQIRGSTFYNTGRTAACTAAIRLQGVASGETGGGLHLTDCEFTGKEGDTSLVPAQILVHTVDGFYINNCHLAHYIVGLRVEPLGTAANNTISDIMVSNTYFDNPHNTNGRCVRLTGIVDSGGAYGLGFYQDIKFSNCLFRGANRAAQCVLIDITDGGAFKSSGRLVKNFSFDGGTIKQAVLGGVLSQGSSSGFLEVYGLTFSGGLYCGENNYGNAATVSGISAEVETLSIDGCIFSADANPATYVISANLSLLDSNLPAFVATGNDFSKATCTGTPIQSSDIGGALTNISDNLYPGSGQEFDQLLKLTTTGAQPTIIWQQIVASTGQAGIVNTRCVGATSDGAQTAMYEHRTAFSKTAAGDAALVGHTVVRASDSITGNEVPVALGLLTGPAWAGTTAYSAGDLITNASKVYLVLVAGTTGAAAPTFTSGTQADGTATLGYVGTEAVNTLALIVSGTAATTIKWIADVEWMAVP